MLQTSVSVFHIDRCIFYRFDVIFDIQRCGVRMVRNFDVSLKIKLEN